LELGGELPDFDVIVIDECHHVGGEMYGRIIRKTGAGTEGGPFLFGLTATPWRPGEKDLVEFFGSPIFTMDMVTGLKKGFLSNVDYRMYTDNINWAALTQLHEAPRDLESV
jgi:superfamily II DNA or RNA helicase